MADLINGYTSPQDTAAFIDRVANNGFLIQALDMDGNSVFGLKVASGGVLPGDLKYPGDQAVPFSYPPEQIEALIASGVLTREIFATKKMDVRLPQELVAQLKANIAASETDPSRAFGIAFVTSRKLEEAQDILLASGLTQEELSKVALIADSGASISIGGRITRESLTDPERTYLNAQAIDDTMQALVDVEISKMGLDLTGRPPLKLESKGVAKNWHYRAILEHYGMAEGSALDKAIKGAMQGALEQYAAAYPDLDRNANQNFKVHGGPATVEVILSRMGKDGAIETLVSEARRAGIEVGSLVASGDDMGGTDGPMARATQELQEKYGIQGHVMLTQHPLDPDGKLNINQPLDPVNLQGPNPLKAAPADIHPDIIVPDPLTNVGNVVALSSANIDAQGLARSAEQLTGASNGQGRTGNGQQSITTDAAGGITPDPTQGQQSLTTKPQQLGRQQTR